MSTIKINAVGFKADAKLEDFIEKKVSKLTNLYDRVLGAEVILKLEAKEKTENKVAEIKLLIPGEDIFAKKQNDTFEEAIDGSVEAIKKQLVKHKTKVVGK